jgi:hypothetical protein
MKSAFGSAAYATPISLHLPKHSVKSRMLGIIVIDLRNRNDTSRS